MLVRVALRKCGGLRERKAQYHKKDRPDCNPKRSNLKYIDGGTVKVFVSRRNRSATAIPQSQGHGDNAQWNTHAIDFRL